MFFFGRFPFQSARYCNQKLLVRLEIPGSAPLLFPGEVNAQGALRFGEENNAWVERWSDGFLLEDLGRDFTKGMDWENKKKGIVGGLASGVSLDELENLKKEDF